MPITRNARDMIAYSLTGCSMTTTHKPFGSTGAVCFIGISTAAHSATSTFLTSPIAIATDGPIASTMNYAAVCTTCVHVLMYRYTFSTCAASGVWGEWGLYNNTSSGNDGILLNRNPDNLGTKSTSASWQLDLSIEITT